MAAKRGVATVTGATSGIGREAARALARRGLHVVVAGRDHTRGSALAEELGAGSTFVAGDISSPQAAVALVSTAIERFGRLDVAVNAAASAAGFGIPTADTTDADFDAQLAVTLKGTWLCMREQLRAMAAAGSGSIVNVGSTDGLGGTRGGSAYGAAKAAVAALTRSAALEYGPGVRVNAVCPGPFDTPMLRGVLEADPEPDALTAAYHDRIPAGRFGEPVEAGELIAWIAVEAPTFLTGACVVVDGGLTA